MKTIVSTKVLSQEQKAILSVLPIHLIEHNFITVSPITMSLTPPYDLLIVTSQNAVKSLSRHPLATTLKETPVLCVGEQTQQLLTQNGFNVLHFAHYASDLVQYLQQNLTSLKKLTSIAFFAGTQRLNTLPNFFVENNLKVKEKQSRYANLHRERWKLRAAPRKQNPKNMFHNLLRDKAQTLLTLRA